MASKNIILIIISFCPFTHQFLLLQSTMSTAVSPQYDAQRGQWIMVDGATTTQSVTDLATPPIATVSTTSSTVSSAAAAAASSSLSSSSRSRSSGAATRAFTTVAAVSGGGGGGRKKKRLTRSLSRRKLSQWGERLRTKTAFATRSNRPYFLMYTLFVQTAVLICMVSLYPLAPINFGKSTVFGTVVKPDGSSQVASRNVSSNFFVGPTLEHLVLLGAKYGPCMRRDPLVEARMNESAEIEAARDYGCCLRTGNAFCFTSTETDCTAGGGSWQANVTCGGASCCVDPSAYPNCDRIPTESLPNTNEYDVCKCEIVARPCCTGVVGDCRIMTQSQCDFYSGVYMENKTECSEVNCLEEECGLSRFNVQGVPDQWYRFFTALFLPVGVFHFVFFGLLQLLVGLTMERAIGWWRFSLLWLISGTGGYLFSALFTPYQIETGPSPCVYGMVSAMIVELFQNWRRVRSPWIELLKLISIMVIALTIGLLPYIDNWARKFFYFYYFYYLFIGSCVIIALENCCCSYDRFCIGRSLLILLTLEVNKAKLQVYLSRNLLPSLHYFSFFNPPPPLIGVCAAHLSKAK